MKIKKERNNVLFSQIKCETMKSSTTCFVHRFFVLSLMFSLVFAVLYQTRWERTAQKIPRTRIQAFFTSQLCALLYCLSDSTFIRLACVRAWDLLCISTHPRNTMSIRVLFVTFFLSSFASVLICVLFTIFRSIFTPHFVLNVHRRCFFLARFFQI